MAKIKQVIRMVNKGAAATVEVQLEDGSTASVWIGGEVEHYYHAGQSKAFVIKGRPKLDKLNLNE